VVTISDTPPDVEAVHLALLRRFGAARRFGLARSVSRDAVWLCRRAIAEGAGTEASVRLLLRFVAFNYGETLAKGVSRDVLARDLRSMGGASADIVAAIAPVAGALIRAGATYYIGGSVASSVHGVPRSTLDADLVADLAPSRVAQFTAELRTCYYVDEEAVRRAVDTRRSFNAIHLPTGLKVDVFIRKDRPFDRVAMDRAVDSQLCEDDSERTFRVATAEDVILAKLEWFRCGGGTSERQWADILGVLRVGSGRLDLDHLDRFARELSVLDLLKRAKTEAAEVDVRRGEEKLPPAASS
jgi:hypothetical protein